MWGKFLVGAEGGGDSPGIRQGLSRHPTTILPQAPP